MDMAVKGGNQLALYCPSLNEISYGRATGMYAIVKNIKGRAIRRRV
jgi:hypothetical protein